MKRFSLTVLLTVLTTAACTSTQLETSTEPSAPKCQVTLSSATATVDATGGVATAQVSAQPECAWTASADVSWITNPSPASGQGSTELQFTVMPNAEAATRQGNLSVNDGRLRVSQAPAPCRFEVSPRTVSLTRAGGNATVTVTTTGGCGWTASADASWLSVSPTTGTGSGNFAISAGANAGLVRIGSVSVAGIPVVVSQEAATPANCQATLQPSAATVPDIAGSGPTITVNIPTGCSWNAQSSVSWLNVTSIANGDGPGTVGFTVAANSGTQRSGVLSIAGQAFTVTQSAAPCSFNVSPTTLSASGTGGPMPSVTVTTASTCSWTSTSEVPWLTFGSSASGTGSSSVQVVAASNTGVARSGTVTIAGTTVNVSQPAVACTFGINPSSQSIGSAGGAGSTISVTAPGPCGWTATTADTWITINTGATGTGNGSVTFTIAANPGAARTGSLTVAGQTFTVNQAAAPAPCSYQISPSSQSFSSAGGAGPTVNVTAGAGCNWTASTADTWITINSGATGGTGNGTVTFTVAANSGAARTGSLTIAGQTFSVTQAAPAAPCTYQINPSSQSFPAAGGAGPTVNVTAGSGCNWTASTSDTFITINSGASGSGNGTVTFTVGANNGPARTGSLSIAGQTFNVSQASGCTVQINPSSQSISAAGGAGTSISVTAASGCTWTASTTDTWITINSGASGSGNGTVTFTIGATTGPARTGTLSVGNQTFTVNQSAGCVVQISPTSASIPKGASTGNTFNVTAGTGCTWTAVSNDPSWLTVTGGASGSGNGVVTYSATANPLSGHTQRIGTISVLTNSFTVTQLN